MNLAITPDGPRGPRRRCAPGAVYLSSKMQIPIVPIGLGYDRPWRMPTWDSFAVPQLYSRARVVTGPALHMPADLDRAEVERYRRQLEQHLESLTTLAERWAHSGSRMVGALRGRRQRAPRVEHTLIAEKSTPIACVQRDAA